MASLALGPELLLRIGSVEGQPANLPSSPPTIEFTTKILKTQRVITGRYARAKISNISSCNHYSLAI